MKKNYFYATGAVLIWATLAAMAKILINDMPNFQVLFVSSLFAFVFLVVTNAVNGSFQCMKQYTLTDYLHMVGLGFIGLFSYSALYYYGLSQLTSQDACILNYLWPMMLVLFSCMILKEKMTAKKLAAMGCSFIGIVILTFGGHAETEGNLLVGVISCIIAAACYGLFSVLNKKSAYNQMIAMMVFWLTTAICSLIAGAMTEQWIALSGKQWLGLLWLGVAIDAIAYLLWALSLSDAENTAAIANMAYLTPFLSLIVSAILLGESIRARAVVALVFIVGGILLQSISKKQNMREKSITGGHLPTVRPK